MHEAKHPTHGIRLLKRKRQKVLNGFENKIFPKGK